MKNSNAKRILTIALGLSLTILLGCGEEDDESFTYCPSINDNITWASYGHFKLENEGNDSTARDIISSCDWHVFKDHDGGYGDTLEVASENEEVVFVWAFNTFYGFRVTAGWKGHTQKKVKMGDSLQDFLAAHPEFKKSDSGAYKFENDDTRVIAKFDQSNSLTQLLIGYYFIS